MTPKPKKPQMFVRCVPSSSSWVEKHLNAFPSSLSLKFLLVSSPYPDFSRTAGVSSQNAFGAGFIYSRCGAALNTIQTVCNLILGVKSPE